MGVPPNGWFVSWKIPSNIETAGSPYFGKHLRVLRITHPLGNPLFNGPRDDFAEDVTFLARAAKAEMGKKVTRGQHVAGKMATSTRLVVNSG